MSFSFSEAKAQEAPKNENQEKEQDKVNFGYKKVNMNEKQGMVNEVFDSVANK